MCFLVGLRYLQRHYLGFGQQQAFLRALGFQRLQSARLRCVSNRLIALPAGAPAAVKGGEAGAPRRTNP
jgi:hypothetical protein